MKRQPWTADEVELLRSMYPDCHAADVAAWLGRTESKVYQAAGRFGLHKTAEYLASDTACRIQRGKQNQNMVAHRFKPGLQPWNKGVKGRTGTQEACRATQFKKGQMAGAAQAKYKPVGTLRINADGVLERKVTDDPSIYPARRWVSVARLVWEAVHGPIPAGHVVRFKAGQLTTDVDQVTVDRLECVTRQDHMRRNSVHNLPPEVAALVLLRGALNRQINARGKGLEKS